MTSACADTVRNATSSTALIPPSWHGLGKRYAYHVRVLAFVVLAGCWHGAAPHEPLAQIDEHVAPMRETRHAPITCKRAITHAIELARAELERTPGMKDRSELIRESLTQSCEV